MNQCLFTGNISKLGELKEGKTSFLKFSVAVPKNFGEGVDYANFTAFGKTAEYMSKASVGQKVAICSHFQTGSYEKDGKKVYTNDFIVDQVETLAKVEFEPATEGLPFD